MFAPPLGVRSSMRGSPGCAEESPLNARMTLAPMVATVHRAFTENDREE
jgi:hypothetical protein